MLCGDAGCCRCTLHSAPCSAATAVFAEDDNRDNTEMEIVASTGTSIYTLCAGRPVQRTRSTYQIVRAHEGQRKGANKKLNICGTKYHTRCLGGGHLSQLSAVSGVCIPRNMQPMWEKDFLTTDPNTPNLLNKQFK